MASWYPSKWEVTKWIRLYFQRLPTTFIRVNNDIDEKYDFSLKVFNQKKKDPVI